MIAIFSPAPDSLAVDRRRQLPFITPIFVAIGYQLGVLIRGASSKIERQFATFADVPYHDRLSRQQWEQLWRAQPKTPASKVDRTRKTHANIFSSLPAQ